jgi:hypothetical protein
MAGKHTVVLMGRSRRQQMVIRDREAEALKLRRSGHTYDEIATAVGFANRGAAHKAVHRALQATIQGPADDLRAMELERLEEAFRTVWPLAIDPTNVDQLKAMDTTLKVMERIDRLTGIDPPPDRGRRRRGPEAPPTVIFPSA